MKFDKNSVKNVNDLNIIHCNIKDLYEHHDEFLSLRTVHVEFDTLFISDIWLTDATKLLHGQFLKKFRNP